MQPTSKFFQSERLKLHYLDWGNADKPLLLLVHGGMDHAHNWDWVAQQMCAEYRVVAIDLRGHGDSEWSNSGDYRIEAFMMDIDTWIDHLGGGPVNIVAHSLGGNVVVRYAGFYPEKFKRIVAIEGLGFSPKMQKQRDATPIEKQFHDYFERRRGVARRTPKRYQSIADACARMQQEHTFLSQHQAQHLTEYGVRKNKDGTYSWKFDNQLYAYQIGDIPQRDIEYLWERISCPTLLIYGADSWASNPAKDGRLQHFKTARLEIFENAGHWVQHDQLAAFVATIKAFFNCEE